MQQLIYFIYWHGTNKATILLQKLSETAFMHVPGMVNIHANCFEMYYKYYTDSFTEWHYFIYRAYVWVLIPF